MRRMLLEVEKDGKIIVLDDESRWEVNPGDMPTVCTWMPTAALEIRALKNGGDQCLCLGKAIDTSDLRG